MSSDGSSPIFKRVPLEKNQTKWWKCHVISRHRGSHTGFVGFAGTTRKPVDCGACEERQLCDNEAIGRHDC